jgi:GDPmannose 4,6-dehydratase
MDEAFLAREITSAISQIILGHEERLYLNDLNLHPGDLFFENMETENFLLPIDTLNRVAASLENTSTIRDFVRGCFYEVGIEIEFSGKGINERAVVIDIDEDKLLSLHLEPDTLRFGQTVVRVTPK